MGLELVWSGFWVGSRGLWGIPANLHPILKTGAQPTRLFAATYVFAFAGELADGVLFTSLLWNADSVSQRGPG